MPVVQEEVILVTVPALRGKVVLKVVFSGLIWYQQVHTKKKLPLGVDNLGVEAREVSSYFLFLRKGRSLSDPESTTR